MYCIETILKKLTNFDSDKRLFTPGPLICSASIKAAMMRDLGSRDIEFIETVKLIRDELLKVADVDSGSFINHVDS